MPHFLAMKRRISNTLKLLLSFFDIIRRSLYLYDSNVCKIKNGNVFFHALSHYSVSDDDGDDDDGRRSVADYLYGFSSNLYAEQWPT